MTVTSIFTNPATGKPYKVGDVLATREEAKAFVEAVGEEWVYYVENGLLEDIDKDKLNQSSFLDGMFLPYTITGFLHHHIAKQAMNAPKPFWLVWVANKNRGFEANQATFATALHDQVPTKRHYSEADAKQEAHRLANLTGARAYVLQAVGFVEPLPPDPRPVRWVEL